YRADPTLVFALEPGQFAFTADKPVSVNPRGLRGKLASYERSPGRTRLLFLGDSIVFGYGVTQGEGVTARVETRLSNENVPAEGINAGVPSYNAEQEVEFLEMEGVRYRPDWVIVGVCWNDINRKTGVLVSREGWLGEAGGNNQSWFLRMSESPMGYALRNGMKKSRLCFAIMQGLRSIEKLLYVDDHTQLMYDVLEGRETPRVADGWNRFGGALHRFAELSHQYHFQALVVTFPPSVALER